jgi:polysaccharide biosynthesis protein PslG
VVRRATGLAALTAAIALLLPAGIAQGAKPSFFGVVTASSRLGDEDFQRLSAGRVATIRRTLFWSQVEQVKGQFNWSAPDRVIGGLASRGIRFFPTVYGSPRFVAKKPAKPPLGSKSDRRKWKEFLRQAVNRYGPGGTYWTGPYPAQHPGAAPVPITAWQIWNEPNLDKFFPPRPSPRRYARLLRISHEAIRGADPTAKIVLAGMPGFAGDIKAWNFLDRLYRVRRVRRSFEAATVHPYSSRLRGVRIQVKRVRRVIRKHGDGHTPLWITELGWGSHHPDRFGLNKGRRGQKRMLTRSFRLIERKRRRWHIQRLFWFEYRDPPRGYKACSFCPYAGLLERDRDPKPAWQAFKRFTGAAP